MSILADGSTRAVVLGMTGAEGTFHTRRMMDYGTAIVAGMTPGKGGRTHLGRPVFNTADEAVRETAADAAVLFVPPLAAADAIMECAAAGIPLIVAVTEGIPTLDMIRVKAFLKGRPVRLIGPNTPGIISPGRCLLGIMPGSIHRPGRIGIVSRSGTLTYEAVGQVSGLGLGQSTAVGIGGDPIIGLRFTDVLRLFEDDDETEAVVLIGEIGDAGEEEAAAYIRDVFSKPVAAFIAGQTAPPGRRMGHAGAIISGGHDTAAEKMDALARAGAWVIPSPADIGATVQRALGRGRSRPASGSDSPEPSPRASARGKKFNTKGNT